MNPYDMYKHSFTQGVEKGDEWVVWIGEERWSIYWNGSYAVEKNYEIKFTPDTLEQAIYFLLDQIGFIKGEEKKGTSDG